MLKLDRRDYPNGFKDVCEDLDVSVHLAPDASSESIADAKRRQPVYTGPIHGYFADLDHNPGFHESFGSEMSPAAICAELRGSGGFVFGGGASATFIIVPANHKPHVPVTGEERESNQDSTAS